MRSSHRLRPRFSASCKVIGVGQILLSDGRTVLDHAASSGLLKLDKPVGDHG